MSAESPTPAVIDRRYKNATSYPQLVTASSFTDSVNFVNFVYNPYLCNSSHSIPFRFSDSAK